MYIEGNGEDFRKMLAILSLENLEKKSPLTI